MTNILLLIVLIFASTTLGLIIASIFYEKEIKQLANKIQSLEQKNNSLLRDIERQKYLDPNRWSNGKLKIKEAKPELIPPHLQ